jgi:hypothetical protein
MRASARVPESIVAIAEMYTDRAGFEIACPQNLRFSSARQRYQSMPLEREKGSRGSVGTTETGHFLIIAIGLAGRT